MNTILLVYIYIYIYRSNNNEEIDFRLNFSYEEGRREGRREEVIEVINREIKIIAYADNIIIYAVLLS